MSLSYVSGDRRRGNVLELGDGVASLSWENVLNQQYHSEPPSAPPVPVALVVASAAVAADAAGTTLVSAADTSASSSSSAISLSAKEGARLVLVTATGVDSLEETEAVTNSIKRRASSAERFVHVCTEAGAERLRGRLENVVAVPDEPLQGYRLSKCKRGNGEPCGKYFESQIKFLYGLVFEHRRMQREGETMPRWWLVKDSDTYVHLPNLMANLDQEREGKPLWMQEVSFSCLKPYCPGVCGGAGWLISAPLAEKLVSRVGDKMVQYELDKIFSEPENSYYDVWLPRLVEWVGAKIEDAPFMSVQHPSDSELCSQSKWFCQDRDEEWCACGRDPNVAPATWHMKGEACCDSMDTIP